jgi:hypothetical protein
LIKIFNSISVAAWSDNLKNPEYTEEPVSIFTHAALSLILVVFDVG